MSAPYDDGSRSLYTLWQGEESQQVVVCQEHGEHMPLVDDETVCAEPAEAGCRCDFCPREVQS